MATEIKPLYRQFQPVNGVALQHQITHFLRQLIVRGDLERDERLPNLRQLAALWQTSHYTVEAGITPLVDERLVVRRPRLGTFVARARQPLQHVGIYCDHIPQPGVQDVFTTAVTTALFQALAASGVHIQAWFDTRPVLQRKHPLPALAKAVAERQVQAVAATSVSDRCLPWLRQLRVPFACVSSMPDLGSVNVDDDAMVRLAVQRLAERGCRRVGLISHAYVKERITSGAPVTDLPLFGLFAAAAQQAGLEVRPSWLVAPTSLPPGIEQCGYDLFRAWWPLGDHPDGLFVFPDTLARGVIHALSELRVDVPHELRLVVHRNQEVEIFSPLPVDWLTVSVHGVAEALLTQLQRQLRGEVATQMLIAPTLEERPALAQAPV